MKARDIMVAPVITTSPDMPIKSVAETLVRHQISAVPVVDGKGALVGIISEGDLLHRAEAGTEKRRPWWLNAFIGADTLANEYIKAHAHKVSDAMTRKVVTASPETPLHKVAELLGKHSIKRVPIVENGRLVGIVSRANLVQAIAGIGGAPEVPPSDSTIRDNLLAHLRDQEWAHINLLNITVNGGVVDLWGIVDSENERQALRVAAEATPGVTTVNDNLKRRPAGILA